MIITNIRVDERLIHGQVATAWCRVLLAGRIMVIDNEAVKSDIQKTALKMACPSGCKLSVLSVKKAAENLMNEKYQGEKIMIVVKRPGTLRDLYDAGYRFDEVNVGNMSGKIGTRALRKTVHVLPQDEEDLKYLSGLGIRITAQMVPEDEKNDLMEYL